MKKYIPIILVILSFCASFSVKIDLWNIKKGITQEEYFCLQEVSAAPLFIVGGLIIVIFPRMFLGWLYAVFMRKPDIPMSTIFFLQILLVPMILLNIRDLIQCWPLLH